MSRMTLRIHLMRNMDVEQEASDAIHTEAIVLNQPHHSAALSFSSPPLVYKITKSKLANPNHTHR